MYKKYFDNSFKPKQAHINNVYNGFAYDIV